jgi:tetratricopeptide (TPR) repeat protein/tRNA A-37 threonylcarbamoyl transferase component Bud32
VNQSRAPKPKTIPGSAREKTMTTGAIGAGAHLSPYRLLSEVGEGGMGTVYRAEDMRDRKTVAIKVWKESPEDPSLVRRLKREFRAVSSLKHPNIVRVLDSGTGKVPFLVMEYVEGSNLRENAVFSERSGLPEVSSRAGRESRDSFLRYVIQILGALRHVHETGIVHGDIKPENILITASGIAKLTDFGLAVFQEELVERGKERTVVGGTPRYFSPEQALGREPDGRSDLYSLGVVFYEFFTGSPPFSGDTFAECLMKRINQDAPFLRQCRPGVPPEIEEVTMRLLEREPDRRFQTAAELAEKLHAFLAGAKDRRPAAPAATAGPEERERLLPVFPPKLAGREHELGIFRDAFERMLSGQGSLLLFQGEQGAGKSRLLEEMDRYAAIRGILAFRGRVVDGTPRPPGPIPSLLEDILERMPGLSDAVLRETAGDNWGVVGEYLPDLARNRGITFPDSGPMDPEGRKTRFLSAILSILENLSLRHPVLIFLDDIQWADEMTAELLIGLRNRLLPSPLPEESRAAGLSLMVVLASRSEDTREKKPLRRIVQALRKGGPSIVVDVGALDPPDLAVMVRSMLAAGSLPAALERKIYDLTAGNPFLAEEIVKWLADEGAIAKRGSEIHFQSPDAFRSLPAGKDQPAALRETVQRRLRRLGPEDYGLLQLSAVLGREFEFTLWQAVAGLEEDRLLDVLNGWIRLKLVDEVPRRPDTYRFHHDIFREIVYNDTPPEVRKKLHGSIASRMERMYRDNPAEMVVPLAHHFYLSGNAEKSLEYLPQAAARLARAYDNEGAVRLYVAALEIEGRLTENDTGESLDRKMSWLKELSEVEILMARYTEAGKNLKTLRELASGARRAQTEVDALNRLAEIDFLTKNQPGAAAHYREAIEKSCDAGYREGEARARTNLGWLQVVSGKPAEAETNICRAIEVYTEQKDRAGLSKCLGHLAFLNQAQGKLARSKEYYRESLKLKERLGDLRGVSATLHNIGNLLLLQGRFRESLEPLNRALAVRKKCGDLMGQAYILQSLGYAYRYLGRLSEALDCSQASLDFCREIGSPVIAHASEVHKAETCLLLGDLEGAHRCVEEACRHCREMGDPIGEKQRQVERGEIRFLQGRFEDAALCFEEAGIAAVAARSSRTLAETHFRRGRFFVFLEALEEAEGLLQKALKLWKSVGNKYAEVQTRTELAWVDTRKGKVEKGCEALRVLLKRAEKMECPELQLDWRPGSRRKPSVTHPGLWRLPRKESSGSTQPRPGSCYQKFSPARTRFEWGRRPWRFSRKRGFLITPFFPVFLWLKGWKRRVSRTSRRTIPPARRICSMSSSRWPAPFRTGSSESGMFRIF